MPQWTIPQLKTSLEKRDLRNLYIMYGEETYLVEAWTRQLCRAALGTGLEDFNFDTFVAGEGSVDRILDVALQLPMMSDHRVVLVKDAHQFKAKDLEVLESIFDQLAGGGSTILIFSARKIDLRLRFFKRLIDLAVACKFDPPFENQIPGWIQFIAQQHACTISNSAALLLQHDVGDRLVDLDQEIQKLKNWMSPRTQIEEADVQQVVSQSRIYSVFAFADALASRNIQSALSCLVHLLDQGESPVGIVAMVARHFRILVQIQSLQASGADQGLAQQVGVHPRFLKDYVQQSKDWTKTQLREAMEVCYSADQGLKSSPVSAHIWLENLALKVGQTNSRCMSHATAGSR